MPVEHFVTCTCKISENEVKIFNVPFYEKERLRDFAKYIKNVHFGEETVIVYGFENEEKQFLQLYKNNLTFSQCGMTGNVSFKLIVAFKE
jgi:hypothetical protein